MTDEATLARLRDALREADTAGESIASGDLLWFGRNGLRVDARLRDATGREHHVVAHDDGAALSVELVLSEPRPVPAQPPTVVVVNGPSGSGKSTLIRAIAAAASLPWVIFDEPILGTTDQPLLVWRDRAPHLHVGFINGIAALAHAGNAVAVAAGAISQAQFRQALTSVRGLYIGLDCPIGLLVERERDRPDRWGGLALQSTDAHDGWTYDLRIDTSEVSPDVAAHKVLAMLA